MKNLAIICVFLWLSSVGYAEEAKTRPEATDGDKSCAKPTEVPNPSAVPHDAASCQPAPPVAQPPIPMPVQCLPAPVSPPETAGDRLEHLLKAAEHLAAAGEMNDAEEVRHLAVQEARKVLARLKALEAKLAGSHRQPEKPPQILVEVKAVELLRTKLRAVGFDHSKLRGDVVVHTPHELFDFQVIDDATQILGLLGALRDDGLAKVLAEPTLATTSGRPAFLHVGGEVPEVVTHADGTQTTERRKYGTQVDLVANILGEERIRLEIRPRISELDEASSTPGKPAFRVREVETGLELKSGQTVVLSGLVQNRRTASEAGEEKHEEIELIWLVRAEIVRGDAQSASYRAEPKEPSVAPAQWHVDPRMLPPRAILQAWPAPVGGVR